MSVRRSLTSIEQKQSVQAEEQESSLVKVMNKLIAIQLRFFVLTDPAIRMLCTKVRDTGLRKLETAAR